MNMSTSLPNPFQEPIVKLPEKNIQKGPNPGGSAYFPLVDVPVVDLSLLLASSSPTRDHELGKLRSALGSYGYIQLINHGIDNYLLDKMQEVSKQFFGLPAEEKQKYSKTLDGFEGYWNYTLLSDPQKKIDWMDLLHLTLNPLEQRNPKFWPKKPENFSEVFDEYATKLTMMSEIILKLMAESLNIGEESFLDQYRGGGGKMVARFNSYPPCPRPDLTLCLKAHADTSLITFLLPDKEVEGLQIMKDDQWYTVSIVPYALLINVGDFTEIMSNGEFKSPLHRVITNSERQRNTLAVFCIPDLKMETKPIDELIDDQRPRLYKNVTDFISISAESSKLGKRPIDAVKL